MNLPQTLHGIARRFLATIEDGGGITPDEFERLAEACNVRLAPRTRGGMHDSVITIQSYSLRFEFIRGRPKPRFVGLTNARAKVRAVVEAYFAQRAAAGAQFNASIDTLSSTTAVAL